MSRVTPGPPPNLLIRPYTLRKGTLLHRIANSDFDENSFNPCMGRPTRFAPIKDAAGNCIPSLYAGDGFACAIYETVFHNVSARAKIKTVRLNELEGREYAVLKMKRGTKVAALFAPELRALGLERSQLVDTSAKYYSRTAAWAKAIHDQFSDIDGLIWTSRQSDPQCAYLLFGDRVSAADLEVHLPGKELLKSADLLEEIRKLGQRAGITLVR